MDYRMPIVDCRFTITHLIGYSNCFLIVMLYSFLSGCGHPEKQAPAETSTKIRFSAIQDGEIWIRHSVIQIRFDPDMYCKIFLNENGKLQSFVDIPPDREKARPVQFVSVNGEELRDFHIDYSNIGVSDIGTQYGIGRRLHLPGLARTTIGIIIRKELKIDLYNDFPDLAFVTCLFRNIDKERPVQLTSIADNFFRLNANRVNSSLHPFDFTFFYGGMEKQSRGSKLMESFTQSVLYEFKRESLGSSPPFFDFWNEEMGMAVGYLTAELTGGELRVRIASDKRVEAGVYYGTVRTLGPGESISTPKSIWIVHRGDFLSPFKWYQKLALRTDRKELSFAPQP